MSVVKKKQKNLKKVVDEHHQALFDIEMKQQRIIDQAKEEQIKKDLSV